MARFRPFKGIRFAGEAAGDMDAAVAPPYDVISEEQRDALYDAGSWNVTRLILNRDGHAEAGRLFREWTEQGNVASDAEDSFYLYSQEFEVEGRLLRRTGVIGALALEPFSRAVVLPHERTFSHHKKDRLELTTEVRANLSPIFGLYSNPDFKPEPPSGWDSPADIDVEHQGVRHRMWVVADQEAAESVQAALAGRQVYIADGHHRYATALNYYAQLNDGADPPSADDAPGDSEQPDAHVMAFLATFEDPGMVILPTHRELVSSGGADHGRFEESLSSGFELQRFERTPDGRGELLAALEQSGAAVNAFGVALKDLDHYLLVSRPAVAEAGSPLAALDVSALHGAVLAEALQAAGGSGPPEITYTVDAASLLDRVDAGELEGGFLLNATRSDQIADVCLAGELMPEKSTYFYPKLLTGLVFHSLEALSGERKHRANG